MDEEIFDEGTLYEEEGHGPDAEEHGEEHSQDEPLSPTHLSDEEELDMDKEEGGVAIEGGSESQKSTTLRVSMDGLGLPPQPSPPMDVPLMLSRPFAPSGRPMAASLPARVSSAKLVRSMPGERAGWPGAAGAQNGSLGQGTEPDGEGAVAGWQRSPSDLCLHAPHCVELSVGTSAPIAIPSMARWGRLGHDGEEHRPEAAATFVPPHQLSRQEDFAFSFSGASPGAALKRDRLRARNAILRSTGFLEPTNVAAAAAVAASPGAGRTGSLPAPPPLPRPAAPQSTLTAALSTIGEV